jgi:putative transposase
VQASHTPDLAAHTPSVPDRLLLISSAQAGLAEQLAGRIDGHLATFVEHMREGLLAASTAVGLEVMTELMNTEVTELAGPQGRHDPTRTATRHGSDDGTVTLGGRRLPIRRPRVRTVGDDAHEIALTSYDAFASTDLLAEHIVAGMLAGLSTRRYDHALEPVGQAVEQAATGMSKSAVSRRFVTATAERLAALLARPLGDQRWVIVFLDGFGLGEHTLAGRAGRGHRGHQGAAGRGRRLDRERGGMHPCGRRPGRPRPVRRSRGLVRG